MRLRNVKNKDEILNNSAYLIKNAEEYCGKWKELFGNDNPIFVEIGMGKGKFIIVLIYVNVVKTNFAFDFTSFNQIIHTVKTLQKCRFTASRWAD